MLMITTEFPAFISSIHVKNYPCYGLVAQAIGSVFVERENPTSRKVTVDYSTNFVSSR